MSNDPANVIHLHPSSSVHRILLCPMCDEQIHDHYDNDPRDTEDLCAEIDLAAAEHLASRHRFRCLLYALTGWRRLVNNFAP